MLLIVDLHMKFGVVSPRKGTSVSSCRREMPYNNCFQLVRSIDAPPAMKSSWPSAKFYANRDVMSIILDMAVPIRDS